MILERFEQYKIIWIMLTIYDIKVKTAFNYRNFFGSKIRWVEDLHPGENENNETLSVETYSSAATNCEIVGDSVAWVVVVAPNLKQNIKIISIFC